MQAEQERTVPELVEYLLQRAERVVVGQSENIELMLLALICGGHILLEGVPGTAKTLMARTSLTGLTAAAVLHHVGLLIDTSMDVGKPEGLRQAISLAVEAAN